MVNGRFSAISKVNGGFPPLSALTKKSAEIRHFSWLMRTIRKTHRIDYGKWLISASFRRRLTVSRHCGFLRHRLAYPGLAASVNHALASG